jgi:hypothetical protein
MVSLDNMGVVDRKCTRGKFHHRHMVQEVKAAAVLAEEMGGADILSLNITIPSRPVS